MSILVPGKAYLYATAPGVMLHELSHALFCLVFGHKVKKVQLFTANGGETIGYVNHAYNMRSPYQRIGNFFIGVAPIICGTVAIYLLARILVPQIFIAQGSSHEAIGFWSLLKLNVLTAVDFAEQLFSFALWKRWTTWLWLALTVVIA